MLITYSYRTYPRTQPVWSIGRSERDRLARSRYRRMAAGPVRNISRMQFKNTSDITLQTDTNRHDNEGELHAKLMSSDRAGFETRHRAKRGCLVSRAAGASGAWKTRGAKSNMRNHAGPPHTGTSSSPSSASSVGGRQIQGFDGGLEGGGCFLILVRVGCFLNLARQDAGGRGLVVR